MHLHLHTSGITHLCTYKHTHVLICAWTNVCRNRCRHSHSYTYTFMSTPINTNHPCGWFSANVRTQCALPIAKMLLFGTLLKVSLNGSACWHEVHWFPQSGISFVLSRKVYWFGARIAHLDAFSFNFRSVFHGETQTILGSFFVVTAARLWQHATCSQGCHLPLVIRHGTSWHIPTGDTLLHCLPCFVPTSVSRTADACHTERKHPTPSHWHKSKMHLQFPGPWHGDYINTHIWTFT